MLSEMTLKQEVRSQGWREALDHIIWAPGSGSEALEPHDFQEYESTDFASLAKVSLNWLSTSCNQKSSAMRWKNL